MPSFIWNHFLVAMLYLIVNVACAANNQYWDTTRKGANIFNQEIAADTWEAASQSHIAFVRLAPDKWKGKQRDFLIGDADHYTGLIPDDLARLKSVMQDANARNVKIVVTMLSLPGARWKQLNHDQNDDRLWRNAQYQNQAVQFWKDLAGSLKNHPALVAYNIINEPHPEVTFGYQDIADININNYVKKVTGTVGDLSLFYQKIVDAIRAVDKHTPIMLDVGMYADPRAFEYFKPVKGDNILYSFHMYEPYNYTNIKRNAGKYQYPGTIPVSSKKTVRIDKKQLQKIYFQSLLQWQKKYRIPSKQIVVGEFGGNRMTKNLDHYFSDLISIFTENQWHWAFYSFREDTWDGMDYELGDKPLGEDYWKAIDQGYQVAPNRIPNPTWQTLKDGLKNKQ